MKKIAGKNQLNISEIVRTDERTDFNSRLYSEQNWSKRLTKKLMVDETGLDEPKVDDTAVDETGLDEPGPYHLTKERLWALNPTDQNYVLTHS